MNRRNKRIYKRNKALINPYKLSFNRVEAELMQCYRLPFYLTGTPLWAFLPVGKHSYNHPPCVYLINFYGDFCDFYHGIIMVSIAQQPKVIYQNKPLFIAKAELDRIISFVADNYEYLIEIVSLPFTEAEAKYTAFHYLPKFEEDFQNQPKLCPMPNLGDLGSSNRQLSQLTIDLSNIYMSRKGRGGIGRFLRRGIKARRCLTLTISENECGVLTVGFTLIVWNGEEWVEAGSNHDFNALYHGLYNDIPSPDCQLYPQDAISTINLIARRYPKIMNYFKIK